jgi:hypothetical protein
MTAAKKKVTAEASEAVETPKKHKEPKVDLAALISKHICNKICACNGQRTPDQCVKRYSETKLEKEKYIFVPFYVIPILPETPNAGKKGYGFTFLMLKSNDARSFREIEDHSGMLLIMHLLTHNAELKAMVSQIPEDKKFNTLQPCKKYNELFSNIAMMINKELQAGHGVIRTHFPNYVEY